MTIKTFCDGCDRVLEHKGDKNTLSVRIGKVGDEPWSTTFDLCPRCLLNFKHDHLPSSWPRVKDPTP
jgi:hypothetical protein